MALFKMSIVHSNDFDKACSACQMAVGCLIVRKRRNVWIVAFNPDDDWLIRVTLEGTGSKYRGPWKF